MLLLVLCCFIVQRVHVVWFCSLMLPLARIYYGKNSHHARFLLPHIGYRVKENQYLSIPSYVIDFLRSDHH